MPKNNPIQKKHAKWKSFFFFLLLATFFWVLTKFSKEYAAPVTSQIEYINIPPSRFLAENNKQEVSFNLFASGFNFLNYTLKKPTLTIDVAKYFNKDLKDVFLSSSQIAKEINLQFPSVNEITAISVDSLWIQLNPVERKKVPVVVPQKINYKSGFKNTDAIKIVPDSIEISGPIDKVAAIDSVVTGVLQLNAISETIAVSLPVKALEDAEIKMDVAEVAVSLVVKEFTQQQFEFNIQVINKPATISLKLIPEKIVMRFLLPVDAYGTISKSDFEIVCDYNNRNDENNFMTPQLLKKPAIVRQIEFESKKIDYLVFKK